MAAAGSVNYSRLKVLLILEGPGTTVLSHTLSRGTHNTLAVDLDDYLNRLPPNSTANYTLLKNKDKKNSFNRSEMKQIRVIHVPVTAVTSDALTPLPDAVDSVRLVLSGVGEQEVETAGRIIASLCPEKKGYTTINFPAASLGFNGWKSLIEKLKETGVKVKYDFFLPDTITTDEEEKLSILTKSLLGCEVIRNAEEVLWW